MPKTASTVSYKTLDIEGMTCASCVSRVEKVIKKLDGVDQVSVNLASESARITFTNNTTLSEEVINEQLKRFGYAIKAPQPKTKNNKNSASANDDYNPYKKDFYLAASLALPILILNMGIMFPWFNNGLGISTAQINQLLLIPTFLVLALPGKRFFNSFVKNTIQFTADMNSLVAIGTGGAFLFSAIITLFPSLLGPMHNGHTYYDTSAVIIALILMGKFLEKRAKNRAGNSIKELLALRPEKVTVIISGKEVVIDFDDLRLGDIVILRNGDKVPADGEIVSGNVLVDESSLTGESDTINKIANNILFSGAVIVNGAAEVKITALGEESFLGRMIKMVEIAQSGKPPVQELTDKISSIFVPVVIAVAFLTFVFWYFFGGENALSVALINSVAVLIIACPCALGLATPAAIITAVGTAAKQGMFVKNAKGLEEASKITSVVFDKTGTLTQRKKSVSYFIEYSPNFTFHRTEILSIEMLSEHPVAQAFVEYFANESVVRIATKQFTSYAGMGVVGEVNGKSIAIGNDELLRSHFPNVTRPTTVDDSSLADNFVIVDNVIVAGFSTAEVILEGAKEAIKQLNSLGIETIMLTGDNDLHARTVAENLNIKSFVAKCSPTDKLEKIKELQNNGAIVAMVGDGVNDAPALAQANLSIAMGSGTAVAIETADVTLIGEKKSLISVTEFVLLAQKTNRIIKQNLFWAFVYNAFGIPLAALGLLNPMIAAFAMSLSSVSVLSNSLRLKKYR